MATFFTATSTSDVLLIVRSLRTHIDLTTIAMQAESDVIEHYTLRQAPMDEYATQFYTGRGYHKGNGMYVHLLGFDPDASVVTDSDLVTALKWTIADVINWRLTQYNENPLVTSEGAPRGTNKAFHEQAFDKFPPKDWDSRLRRWDIRPASYTI